MLPAIVGLHHVTAICGDPQRNLDFYTTVLGLRFVKKTVNFDDPGTYHFYFGDDAGTPGTIITFFPWAGAARGVVGAGEVTHTAYAIPRASLPYWEARLTGHQVAFERTESRFGNAVLTFADPDGMMFELVGTEAGPAARAPRFADVPAEHSLRAFHGVTMLQRDASRTTEALERMGYSKMSEEGDRVRFASSSGSVARFIDILVDPAAGRGRLGRGSVHHIAFRAPDDAAQELWRKEINRHIQTSAVMERDYFRSIYFREPGGVLFELATDTPGFATDETRETLGDALCLPEWLAPQRAAIEQRIIPVVLHKAVMEGAAR